MFPLRSLGRRLGNRRPTAAKLDFPVDEISLVFLHARGATYLCDKKSDKSIGKVYAVCILL